jgi:SepF-like predicted cell division protein (DUF552 family)
MPSTEPPDSDKKMSEEQPPTMEPVIEKSADEVSLTTPSAPSVTAEKTSDESKTYLKAIPLRDLADLEAVENEVRKGNIIILRITPLASKSITDVKAAVNQLYSFAESIHGDIARLGEERVVICPENIRIWREKTPVQNAPSLLPTAA